MISPGAENIAAPAFASPLLAPPLYLPVLETFLRALPFTFRDVERPDGTSVRVGVEGVAEWCLVRRGGAWLLADALGTPAASVTLPAESAWKVWTKRRTPEEKLQAWAGIRIEGDAELGRLVVGMVSVMA